MRQALFSILGEKVEGARVHDLFAGSGALVVEAVSRGAASCRFVDDDRRAVAVIEDNLRRTKLAGGEGSRADVFQFLARDRGSYDLVFADPPYARTRHDRDYVAELLGSEDLRRVIEADGWLVVEMAAEAEAPQTDRWKLEDRRSYGGASILLYAPGEQS